MKSPSAAGERRALVAFALLNTTGIKVDIVSHRRVSFDISSATRLNAPRLNHLSESFSIKNIYDNRKAKGKQILNARKNKNSYLHNYT